MEAMPLPITALYAGLLGLLLVVLGVRIAVIRRRAKVVLFDGGDPELGTAIRVFGNLAEYAPMAVILMALVEINGAPDWVVHALGLVLAAGRLIHPFGLDPERAITFGRVAGMTATWLMIVAAAVLAIYQFAAA